MRTKHRVSTLLAAFLLCWLPAFSMAATVHDFTGLAPDPNQNNDILLLQPVEDGDTLTGTAAPCRLIQVLRISENATVYLKDISVPQGNLALAVENYGPVRLVLQGNNHIVGQPSLAGLEVFGKLIISEQGTLNTNGITALSGMDVILPVYNGKVPGGMCFAGWDVAVQNSSGFSIATMRAGERLQSDTITQILVRFEKLPDPVVPTTGDESPILLWFALVGMSTVGVVCFRHRMKRS